MQWLRVSIAIQYEFIEKLKQFLDGYEIVLNADKIEPALLLEFFNSFHPARQFKMEVSENDLTIS